MSAPTDWWYQFKLFLQHSSGFSMDGLHVIVGILLQLAVARLLRRDLSSLAAWLVVLVVTLLNEVNDLRVEQWPDPGMQYGEGAKDIVLTLVVPTILLILARWRGDWLVAGATRRRKPQRSQAQESLEEQLALDLG